MFAKVQLDIAMAIESRCVLCSLCKKIDNWFSQRN